MTMQGSRYPSQGGKVGSGMSNQIAGEVTSTPVPGRKGGARKTHEFGKGKPVRAVGPNRRGGK